MLPLDAWMKHPCIQREQAMNTCILPSSLMRLLGRMHGRKHEYTEPGMYLIQCTQTQGGIPTTPRSALGSWLIVPEGIGAVPVWP